MLKKINDVSQLPEWFDIERYTQRYHEDASAAARALDDRFQFLWLAETALHRHDGALTSEVTLDFALKKLESLSKQPFVRDGTFVMIEVMEVYKRELYGPEIIAEEEEAGLDEEQMRSEADREVKEILLASGDEYYSGFRDDVSLVTLSDAAHFMEENATLIERVDKAAKLLAEENSWEFGEVRNVMFSHIPLVGMDGSWLVSVCGYPTIESETEGIRRHLKKQFSDGYGTPSVKPSEVTKMFDYRAAAYADLMTWASLTRSELTAKCMANALFPCGRFGELDMRPSRPLGGFFKRLKFQSGYRGDLIKKASEMGAIQL